ncbi:hypothetical protein COX08_01895 [Candidatus Beckwithbacteria bacterium CG23_combo_of_CG06-09_8_20_14_all_34_8]|uniref:Uncharacterized protein n=1 Tax=Candidatus Beckwithbacteria bacterium CG23_combo_of_CG06-09_8_20_14_all_34_8 TaxID=1974497 RepID=A0A2H0B6K7_9BACT|nr:MAG: hypothetical protein COX08_01895 [Candidatus Beckwithbacteria bacterium CG23_combo_of_CG06-09_8_20_14_all_34_8]
MSDLPLPESALEGVNGYLGIALHDRLQRLPEWCFLGQLPREADGLLLPVFNRIMKSAIGTAGRELDTEAERDRILGILRDIAIDLTKPLVEMDLERRGRVISLFDLDPDTVDTNQSTYDQWYGKMFPLKPMREINDKQE